MYSLALFLLVVPLFAEAKSKCQGLVWSIDEKLNLCLAKHCCKTAKGEKAFSDREICLSGLAADMFSCGGGVEHLGKCATKEPFCPKGQSCAWGPFGFGFCCDEKNEAVWHKEYTAECAAPMKAVNIPNVETFDKVLRGKSCKDNFCPKGSKCVQGKYLAHCCL